MPQIFIVIVFAIPVLYAVFLLIFQIARIRFKIYCLPHTPAGNRIDRL